MFKTINGTREISFPIFPFQYTYITAKANKVEKHCHHHLLAICNLPVFFHWLVAIIYRTYATQDTLVY